MRILHFIFMFLAVMGISSPHVHSQEKEKQEPLEEWQIKGVYAVFQDSDPRVWAAAIQESLFIRVLGKMGEAGAAHADKVVALLTHQEEGVRQAAAEALGKMGEAGAAHADKVVALLTHQEERVRWAAAEALGKMGPVSVSLNLEVLYGSYRDSANSFRFRFYSHFFSGGDDQVEILLAWLAKPLAIPPFDHEHGRQALLTFEQVFDISAKYPELHQDLERKIGDIAAKVRWTLEDRPLLERHALRLEQNGSSIAPVVRGVVTELGVKANIVTGSKFWVGHALIWLVLIFVYPRSPHVQAIFFWNPWARRILGLGYIGFALTWVPFLRHALLKPFQESLLADANLSSFDPHAYFADSSVKKKGATERQSIHTAIPTIQGQLILEGDSGLGKTMFLRDLVRQGRRLVVYLPAEKCAKGVMEAIQAKLQGPAKDEAFLRNLIYSGALDLCIDGLNEVSAETRAKISEFVESYFKGNILMTTQPLDWEPPSTAQVYLMQPLNSAQVEEFLLSRWDEVKETSHGSQSQYSVACHTYLQTAVPEKTTLQGKESIQRILSNPMDLSVVAQMLAKGEHPDVFRLQEQQFDVMATEYQRQHNHQEFPLREFSECVYHMRLNDQVSIPDETFINELRCMNQHKMVLLRQYDDHVGNPIKEWNFRHDKVMEYFIVRAFLGEDNNRAEEHLGDPRFSGVYFLLALLLPLQEAELLREKLIQRAADTKDHTVSDRFIQILRSRKVA